MRFIILFFLIGFIAYLAPYWGIPLHSDVTWIARMQNLDPSLSGHVPEALMAGQGYPKEVFQSCADWYQYGGRFNCGDLLALRMQARLAGGNADIWRLIQIITLSLAAFVFYQIGRKWGINKWILVPLSLGFFFSPWGTGTNYIAAETRASLFFLLAVFATSHRGLRGSVFSAIFMILAVLTKETTAFLWPLIFLATWHFNKRNLKTYLSHLAAIGLLGLYVWYFKTYLAVGGSYVALTALQKIGLAEFAYTYYQNLIPGLIYGRWQQLWFGLILAAGIVGVFIKFGFRAIFEKYKENRFLIMGAVTGLLGHGAAYFLTNRFVDGHYVMPANFLFGFLLALLVNPWLKEIAAAIKRNYLLYASIGIAFVLFAQQSTSRVLLNLMFLIASLAVIAILINIRRSQIDKFKIGYLIFVLTLVGIQAERAWANAPNDRTHMRSWQSLIDAVAEKAPPDGHVVLLLGDPYMLEIAQSLEANMIFRGRYDLVFHLVIDQPNFKPDSDFLAYLLNSYNKGGTSLPSPKTGKVLYVKAKRGGAAVQPSPLDLKLILKNPREFLIKRYYFDPNKKPYLEFTASKEKNY